MSAMVRPATRTYDAPSTDATGRADPTGTTDGLRARYLFRAMDAALTAGLRTPPDGGRPGPGTRRYRGMQRVTGLLSAVMPATAERLRRRILDMRHLPFDTRGCELIAFGSGVTVFLIHPAREGEQGTNVLKVFRKSLGMGRESLLRHVRERRAAHHRVMAWYGDLPVVVPTRFLLLHGPLLARPVAACVQPYIGGEKRDVFTDLSESALSSMLEEHGTFRDRLTRFVGATVRAAEQEGACVDLLGQGNLVVREGGAGPELVLLDMGIYDFARKAVRAPAALAAQRDRIAYLQRIVAPRDRR
jgi:hypothetical protein